jgi:putative RecB family exonuclease
MSLATIHTAAPDPQAIRLLPNPGEDPGTGQPVDRSEPHLLRYLSASRLKCWQTCRRQFYYRYVERLAVPTAPALFIGRQIHEVLRLWNWAKWKQEPLTPEQLRATLNERWALDASKEFIPWKTPDDEPLARDQAWAMLETYFAECPVAPDEQPEGVEVEVECDLGAGLPPLYGIIDLVRPGGRIVDYKSTARSPGEDMAAHQHATQLACYALLYRSATGELETGFELHHLIKTKAPKVVVSTYGPMSAAMESELFFLIDDYLEGIAGEAWVPSPGQHCAWCDHLALCRKRSGL